MQTDTNIRENNETLGKELVKKTIEKIVDDFVELKPQSQLEYNQNAITAANLIYNTGKQAYEDCINITPIEVLEVIVKAFAKHSLKQDFVNNKE